MSLSNRTHTLWMAVLMSAIVGAIGVLGLAVAFSGVGFRPDPSPAPVNPEARSLYVIEAEAARSGWTPELAIEAGRFWRASGDPYSAAAYYERADGSPASLRPLSELYIELGDVGRAVPALRRLLETNQEAASRAWANLQIGLILTATDPDGARSHLSEAILLEPGYADSLQALVDVLVASNDPTRIGIALAQSGLWLEAERALRAAGDPLSVALTALAREVQDKDGLPDLRRAVARAPENAQVRMIEGLIYRSREEYDASLTAFIAAAGVDASDPALLAELGLAYQRVGDLPTAEIWLARAVAASGEDPRFSALVEDLRVQEQDLQAEIGLMFQQEAEEMFPPP